MGKVEFDITLFKKKRKKRLLNDDSGGLACKNTRTNGFSALFLARKYLENVLGMIICIIGMPRAS